MVINQGEEGYSGQNRPMEKEGQITGIQGGGSK
jgi:hypothetical protein